MAVEVGVGVWAAVGDGVGLSGGGSLCTAGAVEGTEPMVGVGDRGRGGIWVAVAVGRLVGVENARG